MDIAAGKHVQNTISLPVMDHVLFCAAEYLSRVLAGRIEQALNDHDEEVLTADALTSLMVDAYEKLDRDIRAIIEPAFNLGHSSVCKVYS